MDTGWIETLLGKDPTGWLLGSGEPYAEWVTLTAVLGKPEDSPQVRSARAGVLGDERVSELLRTLPSWGGAEDFPGHHSPAYLPNRLNLLADMGMRGGDDARLEGQLDLMVERQDEHGRFQSYGKLRGLPGPEWGSLLCDTNAITDVLLRFGRKGDLRVQVALSRMAQDLAETPQGTAWKCVPEKRTLFRGPGRKHDLCPQVTLEGLRAFSQLPQSRRPPLLGEAIRAPLEVWRRRGEERPYMFGHGYQFKSVKWPNFWYDVLWVLETVGRFPELWRGPEAAEQDRAAVVEMAACLVAYNFDEEGRVTPKRTYKGFEPFSFGIKTSPSPFATSRCLAALARMPDLAEEIAAIDIGALGSSKGGAGKPVPPKHRFPISPPPPEPSACPAPPPVPNFTFQEAVARVLARHHLGTPWIAASVETVVADIVGLHATAPETPYLSLLARLPTFSREQLDSALYERRSLVRFRCMRGTFFIVRRDMLPAAHAASTDQVVRYARAFAKYRGVDADRYDELSSRVMDIVHEGPATTREIGRRLRQEGLTPNADVSALVTLMTADGLLLRDRPRGGWLDRSVTYVPLADVLPNAALGIRRDDADVTLVRHYLRAFGPALEKDAAWWSGIGPKRVNRALRALGDEVVEVELTGPAAQPNPYLMHAADLDELAGARVTDSPQVALLPVLDPLIMGYALKERFVPEERRSLVFDRAGNSTSVVLLDGGTAGVWDVERDPARARVLVHLFGDQPAKVRDAVFSAGEALGRFWHGRAVPVEAVPEMTPLTGRSIGSFQKPLRA